MSTDRKTRLGLPRSGVPWNLGPANAPSSIRSSGEEQGDA